MKKILVTTGDTDGIGLQIAIEALNRIRIPQSCQIFLYCSSSQVGQLKKLKGLRGHVADTLPQAFRLAGRDPKSKIFVVATTESPPRWVEQAARVCMRKEAHALVTGPMSKPLIKAEGLKDLGHTEILARISGCKELFMSFWGSKANVVLLTGHIPLDKVPRQLTPARLKLALTVTRQFLKSTQPGLLHKKIALVGINPHAGDMGLIGKQDQKLAQIIRKDRGLLGPLPGDSAFIPKNLQRVGVFLASYHDQGLIPFKLLHGFDEGVHVTLGLPFLRTSVDHGPAKELFGKKHANFGSMKQALEMAIASTKTSRARPE